MAERQGFLLYHTDLADLFDLYGFAEVGQLVQALFLFSTEGQDIALADRGLEAKRREMARKITRDADQYVKKCEANRVNSRKRWNSTASDRIRSHATEDQTEAGTERQTETGGGAGIPASAQAVRDYSAAEGLPDEADAFFAYYSARDWTLKDGQTISNWQAAYRSWLARAGQFSGSRGSAAVRGIERPSAEIDPIYQRIEQNSLEQLYGKEET